MDTEEEANMEKITLKRYQCSKNSFTKTVGVQPHTNGQIEIIILWKRYIWNVTLTVCSLFQKKKYLGKAQVPI